jgi:hypothetical protein
MTQKAQAGQMNDEQQERVGEQIGAGLTDRGRVGWIGTLILYHLKGTYVGQWQLDSTAQTSLLLEHKEGMQ